MGSASSTFIPIDETENDEENTYGAKLGDLLEFVTADDSPNHWAIYGGKMNVKGKWRSYAIHVTSATKSDLAAAQLLSVATSIMGRAREDQPIPEQLLTNWISCKAEVRIDEVTSIASGFQLACVRVNNSSDAFLKPLKQYEILANAFLQVNQHYDFHLIANNDEHFAKGCRYGKKISSQALNFIVLNMKLVKEWSMTDSVLKKFMDDMIDDYVNYIPSKESSKIAVEDYEELPPKYQLKDENPPPKYEVKNDQPLDSRNKQSRGRPRVEKEVECGSSQRKPTEDETRDEIIETNDVLLAGIEDLDVIEKDMTLVLNILMELDLQHCLIIPRDMKIIRIGTFENGIDRLMRLQFSCLDNKKVFIKRFQKCIEQFNEREIFLFPEEACNA